MTLGFLDRFRTRRDPMPSAQVDGLAQARAYWEALRDGTSIPTRQSIDPRGLTGTLDRVFLADRIGRGLAQIRVAGSAITDFAGLDVRGLPFSCLFAPEARGLLAETLEEVFAGPAVAELDLGSDRGTASAPVARLLLLPLADETGAHLVLGVLGLADPSPARCKLVIRSRQVDRLAPPRPAAEAPVRAAAPIRQIRHLALVHSAD